MENNNQVTGAAAPSRTPQPQPLQKAKNPTVVERIKARIFPGGNFNKRWLIVLAIPVFLFAVMWRPEGVKRVRLGAGGAKAKSGERTPQVAGVTSPPRQTAHTPPKTNSAEDARGGGGDNQESIEEVAYKSRRPARYSTAKYEHEPAAPKSTPERAAIVSTRRSFTGAVLRAGLEEEANTRAAPLRESVRAATPALVTDDDGRAGREGGRGADAAAHPSARHQASAGID